MRDRSASYCDDGTSEVAKRRLPILFSIDTKKVWGQNASLSDSRFKEEHDFFAAVFNFYILCFGLLYQMFFFDCQ